MSGLPMPNMEVILAEQRKAAEQHDDDLRNDFAKIALAKALERCPISEEELSALSCACWAIADAMMAKRKRGGR